MSAPYAGVNLAWLTLTCPATPAQWRGSTDTNGVYIRYRSGVLSVDWMPRPLGRAVEFDFHARATPWAPRPPGFIWLARGHYRNCGYMDLPRMLELTGFTFDDYTIEWGGDALPCGCMTPGADERLLAVCGALFGRKVIARIPVDQGDWDEKC